MNFEAKRFIKEAFRVILVNPLPFIFLLILHCIQLFLGRSGNVQNEVIIFPTLFLMIFYPLVYGQYVEIIFKHKKASYLKIFNEHWFNLFVVNVLLGLPLILILFFSTIFHDSFDFLKTPLHLLISSIGIYVVPLVFIIKKRIKSILLGIKCLIGNLFFSLPLIVVHFMPLLASVALPDMPKNIGSTLQIVIAFVFMSFQISLDFIVFISAVLILKEKLFFSMGLTGD